MAAYPKSILTSANKLSQLPPDEAPSGGRRPVERGQVERHQRDHPRKGLARTSKHGRTRLLNFFELRTGRRLVTCRLRLRQVGGDMRAHWGTLLQGYFANGRRCKAPWWS